MRAVIGMMAGGLLLAGCATQTPQVDQTVVEFLPRPEAVAFLQATTRPAFAHTLDPCRITDQGVQGGGKLIPFNQITAVMEHLKTTSWYKVDLREQGLFPMVCSYYAVQNPPDLAAVQTTFDKIGTALVSLGGRVEK